MTSIVSQGRQQSQGCHAGIAHLKHGGNIFNLDITPDGLVGGVVPVEDAAEGAEMTLTKVWMPEAATEPALATVLRKTVSAFCSAAASVCACAVACDTWIASSTINTHFL